MMGGLDRRMMMRSTHILLSALFCGIAKSYSPTQMLPSQIRLSARPLTRLVPARATLFSPHYAHRPARVIMASTAINTATHTNDLSEVKDVERIAVVGGGPAGLSTAIMLARRGFKKIEVKATRAVASVPTCSSHYFLHFGECIAVEAATPHLRLGCPKAFCATLCSWIHLAACIAGV